MKWSEVILENMISLVQGVLLLVTLVATVWAVPVMSDDNDDESVTMPDQTAEEWFLHHWKHR